MKRPSTIVGHPRLGVNGQLALVAVATFVAGVLVYIFDRPAATVYLLPQALSFAGRHYAWFGVFGDQLPEFIHVYAFILLTVAVGPGPARVTPICAFWWSVDSLVEVGQHPAVAPHIAAALPAWFQHIPFLDHTANYFLHGTFDPGDLVAIALGTVVAYFTVGVIRQREVGHVPDTQIRS